MPTPEELLAQAASEAVAATQIAKDWANRPAGWFSYTESGPLPSIKQFLAEKAELIDAGIATVQSIEALRLLPARFNGQQVFLSGYYAGSTKGAGPLVATITDSPVDDGGVNIAGPNCQWVRQLDGFVTPEMFGAQVSDISSAAVNLTAINSAAAFCAANNSELLINGRYYISSRFTSPENITIKGLGFNVSELIITSDDRVVVLSNGCEISDIHLNANSLQVGTQKLSVMQVGSNCKGRNIKLSNGYSNIAFSGTKSKFSKVYSINAASRGAIFSEGAIDNSISGYQSENCVNAGVLFGQGATRNKVNNFNIKGTTLNPIWFIDGANNNTISNGFVSDPATPNANTVLFGQGAFKNKVSYIKSSGLRRAIFFQASPSLFATENFEDLRGNIVDNCEFEGVAELSSVYAVTFGRSSATKVGAIELKNCSFSNYYGIFENDNNSVDGALIKDIKTSSVGLGGIIGSMRGTGFAKLENIEGVNLSFNFLTEAFDITSTGTKTVVISHGLPYAPKLSLLHVGLQRVSTVEDFKIDHLWPVASTDSSITVRAKVGVASATTGAVAKMNINYSTFDNEQFDLSTINV